MFPESHKSNILSICASGTYYTKHCYSWYSNTLYPEPPQLVKTNIVTIFRCVADCIGYIIITLHHFALAGEYYQQAILVQACLRAPHVVAEVVPKGPPQLRDEGI